MQVKGPIEEKPIRFVLDERLDFNHGVPLAKSYIVASSYRSGSNYLCHELWRTGVLGSPVEFLNPTDALPVLTNRFKTTSPADYIRKLIAHRTSRNGVFGLKTHFHHFEAFLAQYPALLELLAPVTFIHLDRRDKVAQAVSMAKALQTDFWTSRIESERVAPQYDYELIAKCLDDVVLQEQSWPRWFQKHGITPFKVQYEELTADTPGVVRRIVDLLGVAGDEADTVRVPPMKRQGDETNKSWIERFHLDTSKSRMRVVSAPPLAREIGAEAAEPGHFVDRYDQFVKTLPAGPGSASGFVDMIRLRHRHNAIVGRNREAFKDARVLDIMGSNGVWSLAALDAGARHVTSLITSRQSTEGVRETFEEYGFGRDRYQVAHLSAARDYPSGAFDLVMCGRYVERTDPRLVFAELRRLAPKHVILDTGIVRGSGPIARFSLRARARARGEVENRTTMMGTPNHELIMFLCEYFDFQWRLIDWQSMGITNWTGVHDYGRGERRTYFLDRVA